MAGMDWFRWHHGSVTDPKFQMIARKTNSRTVDVLGVWAYLLEAASMSDNRGNAGGQDFEVIDFVLGLNDGQAQTIHAELIVRGMIFADGQIASWERRQTKRERVDDKSTDRVTAFRKRQRNETPCNAMKRQETPRVDKIREDDSVPSGTAGKPAPMTDPDEIIFVYGVSMLTNAGTSEKQARSFLGGLRKHHGDEALIDKLRECARAKPLEPLTWLAAALPPKGAPPRVQQETFAERDERNARERFESAVGRSKQATVVDMEFLEIEK